MDRGLEVSADSFAIISAPTITTSPTSGITRTLYDSLMRIKLRHLFGLILIAAIALVAVDHTSRSSATVEFYNAKSTGHDTYTVDFSVRGGQNYVDGTTGAHFGYNRLLGSDISESNLSQLNGREVEITFRQQRLLWLPAVSAGEKVTSHFGGFPAIIWRDKTGCVDESAN